MTDSPKTGTGLGARWAIKCALADALRRAADDLETKDLDSEDQRPYSASIDWPTLYTLKPEEGPAALRAVANEITLAEAETRAEDHRE